MTSTITSALPTLYEYYTEPLITSGLSADQSYFTLNDRNVSLYSGAMHYFRVPKEYWRDRLRKMRAAGLNAVETYIPWNLHEPENGKFDFGNGTSEMSDFLDVKQFLTIAKEEDLFAIVRPGPFICAEWEFGGFPSWLLRDRHIKFRTSDPLYMKYVTRFFNALLSILSLLQFTQDGPIVAFQIENEYGSTESETFVPDKQYLKMLREIYIKNGIDELLFTSDSPSSHGSAGTLPEYFLQTANFASNPEREFDALKKLQKDKPTMATEFWTGWFDHWSENHHTRDNKDFRDVYESILKYPASVSMYMFEGGTSFGFMNGANLGNQLTDNSGYQPDTTSYDYDAPLSENGDYTEKYVIVKDLLAKYNQIKTRLPLTPAIISRTAYPSAKITKQMWLTDVLDSMEPCLENSTVRPMELLPINNKSGQSYGYVVYEIENLNIPANSILTIEGHVCDTVVVLVDGILMSKPLTVLSDLDGFGFWRLNNSNITLGPEKLTNATLTLMVENFGRNNYGYLTQFYQYKGLWQGDVFLNELKLPNWNIYSLEFKKAWNNGLTGWRDYSPKWAPGPSLNKAVLNIENPQDTYVNMEDWTKGIVIVNGFVLGRYAKIGPQQSLYLPAPFLKKGLNTFMVFEHYIPNNIIRFVEERIYKTAPANKN